MASPPVDPNSLSLPLNPTQRAAVTQWIELQYVTGKVSGSLPKGNLSDAQIIGIYKQVVAEESIKAPITIPNPISSITAGIHSVTDFLKLLTQGQLWIRIGEVVLGLLLIAVGAAKMSNTANSTISQIPLAGKLIK